MTRAWMTCTLFETGKGVCGAQAAHRYLPGPRCPRHTPAAIAGRPEAVPDPALTLEGLRAMDGATKTRLQRSARRRAQGGRTPVPKRKPKGRPGERFFTADDVDMDKVHAVQARLGVRLEAQRLARIAARDAGGA